MRVGRALCLVGALTAACDATPGASTDAARDAAANPDAVPTPSVDATVVADGTPSPDLALVRDSTPSLPDAALFLPDAAPATPDAAQMFPDAALAPPDAAVPMPDFAWFPDAAPSLPDAAPALPDAALPMPDFAWFPDAALSLPDIGWFPDAVLPPPDMAWFPDAALPDAAIPDAALPDAAIPDAALPDAVIPDATLPDAEPPVADAAPPDPDAALPCTEGEQRACGVCPGAFERCVAGAFGACANPGADCRGAAVPWDEYEAEAGLTNAVVLPPSVVVGTVAAEMSGRSGVRLSTVGDFVEFTAARAANALVVRYSIPDAGDATLNVYVNDTFRAALPLTPRYAWHYGLNAWLNGGASLPSQDPAVGTPFHFFDEVRMRLDDMPAGARVRLQKDVENAAADYTIDLIDLEWAPPPAEMPAGFLSLVTDCGATPDDAVDDAQALADCLTRGRDTGRGVWIPPGRFDLAASPARRRGFVVDRNTVQGAGMWHSVLAGAGAGFYCTGNDCRFSDFALFGETVVRDDTAPDNGFQGSFGTGSALERVWIEHKKVGLWAGLDVQPNGQTDGLVVSDCRIRNVFADGINLVNGTRNTTVTNTHLRGTGDDALAQWSYVQPGPVNRGNRFAHNTVQLPWRATCFAVYGGEDATIEDSLCSDTLTFPGLQIGGPYPQLPFGGTTAVRRNTLTRAGGTSFNQKFGALKLLAYQVDQIGVLVEDVEIVDPTYFGLEFSANAADASRVVDAVLQRVTIRRAGEYGIMVRASARGSATLSDVVVEAPGLGGLRSPGGPAPTFRLDRGPGNVGF